MLKRLTTDLNSSTLISFDQTLWKIVSFQNYSFISRKNLIYVLENLTTDSDSLYSITYIWTIAEPLNVLEYLSTDTDVLLTFDPTPDPRMGLLDSDYPRSNHVPLMNGQQLVVTKIDVLLTFDPTSDPGFVLSDPDYPRSN